MGKGGGGSSTPASTTTTSTVNPPAYLKPYLTDLASEAHKAYGQVSKTPYTGDLIASPVQAQTDANTLALNVAKNAGNLGDSYRDAAGVAQNYLDSGAGSKYLNTSFTPTDPNGTAAFNAMIQPLKANLENTTLPSLDSAAVAGGAYGGSRAGQVKTQAVNDFDQAAANAAATLAYQSTNANNQLRAADLLSQRENESKNSLVNQQLLSLIPTLNSQGYTADLQPATTLQTVGANQQLTNQDLLDEAYAKWQMGQLAPFQGLSDYASIIYGNTGGSTGTATSTPKAAGSSGFGGAVTGALGGAASGAAIGSIIPGVGTGIGAAAGGLAGLLGSW